jgi:hypothetical protein
VTPARFPIQGTNAAQGLSYQGLATRVASSCRYQECLSWCSSLCGKLCKSPPHAFEVYMLNGVKIAVRTQSIRSSFHRVLTVWAASRRTMHAAGTGVGPVAPACAALKPAPVSHSGLGASGRMTALTQCTPARAPPGQILCMTAPQHGAAHTHVLAVCDVSHGGPRAARRARRLEARASAHPARHGRPEPGPLEALPQERARRRRGALHPLLISAAACRSQQCWHALCTASACATPSEAVAAAPLACASGVMIHTSGRARALMLALVEKRLNNTFSQSAGTGQVPPARRPGRLRHARAHGAALRDGRVPRRRPRQLWFDRQ